jgi:hypothetical protein
MGFSLHSPSRAISSEVRHGSEFVSISPLACYFEQIVHRGQHRPGSTLAESHQTMVCKAKIDARVCTAQTAGLAMLGGEVVKCRFIRFS